ncbi:MAG: MFS transporter [Clostridiales bacterium]|nr:MFS transporter [Clostridiales bacterium]
MNINTKKLEVQYSILQGAYWASFCVIYGFATVFLLSKGFNSAQIGVMIAVGNVLGVVMQPYFASIADASGKLDLHRLTALLSGVLAVLLLLLCLAPNWLAATAFLFVLSDVFLQVIQPLVNSVSVYYVNRGVQMDFGIARGVGSLSYAGASYVLGLLVEHFGSVTVPLLGLFLMVIVVLTMCSLPVLQEGMQEARQQKKESSDISIWRFFGKYKNFTLTLAGITLLFTFHNMSNSYLIQIVSHLGGDSAQMGTALSIAAVLELPVMVFFSRLVKRFSSRTLLIVSGMFFVLKALSLLLVGNMFQLYLQQMLQMGSFALYVPASVYYVNEHMAEQDKFKGQAVMTGTNTLGGVLGSLLGGFLLNASGVELMLQVEFAVAALGGVLVLLSAGKKDE